MSVRKLFAFAVLVLALAGCGGTDDGSDGGPGGGKPTTTSGDGY